MNNLVIYELTNPSVCFRVCNTLKSDVPDWCTNYGKDGDWNKKFTCRQQNVHFYCPIYKNIELVENMENIDFTNETIWWCEKCKQCDRTYEGIRLNKEDIVRRARIIVESEKLKNACLIRIDEQCSELKINKLKTNTPTYVAWGKIETDIVGNPQVNLYIACSDDKGKKVHYFIEPEVEKIRHEISNTDIDPATIISKIQITLKDRRIIYEYD